MLEDGHCVKAFYVQERALSKMTRSTGITLACAFADVESSLEVVADFAAVGAVIYWAFLEESGRTSMPSQSESS